MAHRQRILAYLLFVVLALVAVWVWFAHLRTPGFDIVEAGARLTSASLDITSRTIVVVPPEPGVVFSTVRKPGNKEQFAYVLLLNYGHRIRSSSSFIVSRGLPVPPGAQLDHSGRWAETTTALELNGKPIEASYRVELDETGTAVANEALTIAGKPVDMMSGQVFLVDLTGEPPVYRQMKVELPPTPIKLQTTEDAERAAEAIRERLGSQHVEIKAFLR